MARQLRFDTPEELADKIIDKLSQEELNVTTRALIVHVHAQIPVKELEKRVAASNNAVVETSRQPKARKPQVSTDKMWLYQAKKGWALSNLTMPVDRVVQRLQSHYGCKILATKEGKINFLPSKPTTIDELQKNGFVVYRQDLNKKAA
ncbi:hypothetical protein [Pseudanabaena mucicola]|uniref:Uncharacterized protein n=1 Tax=Pseudanabaena mucicola FACHB-723 TaxID=2692860 RepID=A0ABR8A320_9CYAN|nr:hypothetical protein [Pseudanabaena mucicola]MBD2190018.1 hypothetical protein [Pseudanabaena mucicola FACHB-723]